MSKTREIVELYLISSHPIPSHPNLTLSTRKTSLESPDSRSRCQHQQQQQPPQAWGLAIAALPHTILLDHPQPSSLGKSTPARAASDPLPGGQHGDAVWWGCLSIHSRKWQSGTSYHGEGTVSRSSLENPIRWCLILYRPPQPYSLFLCSKSRYWFMPSNPQGLVWLDND